jgi:hypothetical protein
VQLNDTLRVRSKDVQANSGKMVRLMIDSYSYEKESKDNSVRQFLAPSMIYS